MLNDKKAFGFKVLPKSTDLEWEGGCQGREVQEQIPSVDPGGVASESSRIFSIDRSLPPPGSGSG